MIDFRHIIKLNKLVILTGLFFICNSVLFCQNSFKDSVLNDELKLYSVGSLSNGILQIYSDQGKTKSITNYENGLPIVHYSITKNKSLFNRFSKNEYLYTYDSLNRLVNVSMKTDGDWFTKDTIHYNIENRVDFYHSYSEIPIEKELIIYSFKYELSHIIENIYYLIDSINIDTILLNQHNGYVHFNGRKSVAKINNDSLTIYTYYKQFNEDTASLKMKELYVNKEIQFRKTYSINPYKRLDSIVIQWFYERGNNFLIKYDDPRFSNYTINYFDGNNINIKSVHFLHQDYETKITIDNVNYYYEYKYKKEDLKSMF